MKNRQVLFDDRKIYEKSKQKKAMNKKVARKAKNFLKEFHTKEDN